MSHGEDLPTAEDLPSGQLASSRLSAADAERLIVRHWAHPEAGAEQHRLAALLDSVTAPPTDQELSGQAAAVAAFVLVTGGRAARSRRGASRRAMGIAAGIVAASIAAGFSGAAAADALPGPIQELAHQTFGAPAPGPSAPGVKPVHVPGWSAHMHGATKGKGNARGKGHAQGTSRGKGNKGMPPGLAKKTGGVPPGQAKKTGGTPPGQAKKGVSSPPETAPSSSSPQRSKLLFSGLTKQYEPRHASPARWSWSSGLSAKTSRSQPSQPGPQRA